MSNEEKINLLVDDSRGVYIPLSFITGYDLALWGLTRKPGPNMIGGACLNDDIAWAIDCISDGPEHEHYWDAWGVILNEAKHVDDYGNEWRLWQDGNLFAVCSDYDFEEL